jgi:hypothetical protein
VGEIVLHNQMVTLVDDDIEDMYGDVNWTFKRRPSGPDGAGYAVRMERQDDGKRKMIYLHLLVMPPRDGYLVDHVGDLLDNRRENLRYILRSEAGRNRQSARAASSFYIGVSWVEGRGWCSQIAIDGVNRVIGWFGTDPEGEIRAAEARDVETQRVFGALGRLNFPDPD